MNILIVDDSPPVRAILTRVLTSLGFEVAEAENGIVGLEYLKAHAPDCIMTDVNMPGMDGLTFIERARRMPNGRLAAIFVLSSETCPHKLERANRCGVAAWMTKPMSPPVLAAALLQAVA